MRLALPLSRRSRPAALVGLAGLLAACLLAVTPGGAAGDPEGRGAGAPDGEDGPRSITLVTGDRLDVREEGAGHRSVQFVPGPGRDSITVHQIENDGETFFYPEDVLPLLTADRLDEDLFNLDLLLADGYDDATLDTVPLIAVTSGSPRTVNGLDGADAGATLTSIDARVLDVDKSGASDFWADVTASRARLSTGIEKLWLDHKVEADLDRSVPQIGAPSAWEAGFDGAGVKVAVLDTGVDADHPDLTGQVVAAENFSDSNTIDDAFGHGTHVAATITGSGEGSTPARSGVAPGADLMSGKVLDDAGSGWTSDIVEAMEWAVDGEADVVNMSLGGGPTDGTDPLSVAVNELSDSTLFVVSAGNDGPSASSIGSPGAADDALTVGAVDRDESLADFSSRGPRVGDLAIKPDITAPGVEIVAARGSGTTMGTPVDELYTAASGTSMAAPHVAGAAAILAQQHPEWSGTQLKDGLVSTALPSDLTEQEEGGGRVDVERAVGQKVYATGAVNLGSFTVEDRSVVTRPVTWTNTTDQDVRLALDLDVTDLSGNAPAAGALKLTADTTTVPAGGTATVDLVLDPALLGRGQYAGQLVASAGDTVVHTTVGAVVSAPVHEVTIKPIGFDGEFQSATPVILKGEDPRFDTVIDVWKGEPVTVELGEGDYFLSANMSPDYRGEDAAVSITDPDVHVTEDMVLTLDARKATRVEIDTPRPSVLAHDLGYTVRRVKASRTLSHSVQKFATTRSMWVTPTDKAEGGEFEFTSRWQMAEPMLSARTIGGGAPLKLTPHYERYSPAIEGRQRWDVVPAGEGKPEDYAGLDVEGKIALVTPTGKGRQDVDAAVEAGAEMLLISPPEGSSWPTKYTGRGTRLDLPVAVLTPHEADLVAARLGKRPLRLRLDGVRNSRYLYDIVQVSQGQVPRRVLHRVTDRNSTTITANYHEMGGEPWAKEQRFAWRPWQEYTIIEKQRELATPQQRTEVVSSGVDDTLWRQHVLSLFSWDSTSPLKSGAIHPIGTYETGTRFTQDWFAAVVRPDVPVDRTPSRTGDLLDLHVAELAGNGGATYDRASAAETTMLLHEDGRLVGSGDAAWGSYPVKKADAEYTLDLTVTREAVPTWEFSTRTDTTWTFQSARSGKKAAALPLLQVDYDVPVGLDNTVTAGKRGTLAFTVAPGTADSGRVRSLRSWVSYDDGDSWQKLRVLRGARNTWRAVVRHPKEAGHASLRVEARDRSGNAIEQTVLRAYGVRAGR